ncbi:MAG: hypothetical protein J1E64_10125 [Acetatifactor sp.]|nr:hypothetical protein [Acetatifactor sp.]
MRGKIFGFVSTALPVACLLFGGCGAQEDQQVNDTLVESGTKQSVEESGTGVTGAAEVLIAPDSTIERLMQGSVVSVDLDGDGNQEVLTVSSESSAEEPSFIGGEDLPEIQVSDQVFTGQYLYELGCYGENPDWESWYLFDIDVNDSYKEIGLYFDGPSGDPQTYLFRFAEGQLINLGSFYICPYSYFDEKIQITVPGDGTITGVGRVDLVETNFATRMWKLKEADEPDAYLEEVPLEVYELAQYDRTMGIGVITTRQEIAVYADKSLDAAGVSISEGTEVAFLRFHVSAWGEDAWPEEGWMELTWGDGQTGYFFWSGYGEDGVTTPDGSFLAEDLFMNLSHAG